MVPMSAVLDTVWACRWPLGLLWAIALAGVFAMNHGDNGTERD